MRPSLFATLLVSGLILVGCEKSDSTSSTPAQPAPSGAERTASDRTAAGMDSAQKEVAGATDAAKQQAAGAVEGAKAAGDQATSAIQGEGQKLLDQAMQYIKENKFELADQTLVKLEGMKAQLPETMQKSIAQARTALDTAKKGAGMLPGSGK
jgi:vacuolar-type H+-ATPase subunit H